VQGVGLAGFVSGTGLHLQDLVGVRAAEVMTTLQKKFLEEL
jgi:hypothetical protein